MLTDCLDERGDALVRAMVRVLRYIVIRLPRAMWDWGINYLPLAENSLIAVFQLSILQFNVLPKFSWVVPLAESRVSRASLHPNVASIHGGPTLVQILISCWKLHTLSGEVWGSSCRKRKLKPINPPMGDAEGVCRLAIAIRVFRILSVSPPPLINNSLPTARRGETLHDKTDQFINAEMENLRLVAHISEAEGISRILAADDGQRRIISAMTQFDVDSRETVLRMSGQSERKPARIKNRLCEDIAFLEQMPDSALRKVA